MTSILAWSKKHFFIYSLGLITFGLLTGVLFQKYYSVGQLLRSNRVSNQETQTPTPLPVPADRVQVPLAAVSTGRTMVALVFGQSNSANFGENPQAADERIYNFYRGRLYIAKDPMLGADGYGGSVWSRLGNKMIKKNLYDAVIFVPLGVASTSIESWQPGGNLYSTLSEAIRDLENNQLNITHLLWHQGEADAGLGTSKEAYKQGFRTMLEGIRSQGVGAPIYVSVATRCEKERGKREIQEAQKELVDPHNGIYAGPNTDELGFAFRYDGCHFSDEGLEEAADLWLQALRQ